MGDISIVLGIEVLMKRLNLPVEDFKCASLEGEGKETILTLKFRGVENGKKA